MKELTVLCKVVDNFGDIGVVFRLCRSISESDPKIKIRLVVSDLSSFKKIARGIRDDAPAQEFRGWKIFDWNDSELCGKEFSENPPQRILECFQCGRPEWLEEILFAPEFQREVKVANVEYLTAEAWADDFHLLKSGTRSRYVKKINFMPGFTKKTGGLILDGNFMRCVRDKKFALERLPAELCEKFSDAGLFKIVLFSYPHDFSFLRSALDEFSRGERVAVFVASGAGKECAMKELGAAKNSRSVNSLSVFELPYLEQESWDALLTLSDFLFVRGEDSFSRACLCGIPFAWNIYPQEGEFHLVKLAAFFSRLNEFRSDCDDEFLFALKKFSFIYNRSFSSEPSLEAWDAISKIDGFPESHEGALAVMETLCLFLLRSSRNVRPLFSRLSNSLVGNGSLARNLLLALE